MSGMMDMSSEPKSKSKLKPKYENSKWIMASYGSREMFSQWITSAFGLYTIVYYETVVGLSQNLALIAFLIFSLWNAVNDPIIGYLIERFPLPWQKKKGYKRFPWIVIAVVPWLISYVAIFLVPYEWDPVLDQWKIFGWYVVTLIIFDSTFSLMDINSVSLFPEKFRKLDERRTAQGFGTILGILGIVLAFIVTGMFFPENMDLLSREDAMSAYRTVGKVSLVGGVFLFLLVIPGIFENKTMRERNLLYLKELKPDEQVSFFSKVKEVLSNKAFIFKVIFFFGYQVAVTLVNASALYVTIFLLDDPGAMIFLLGSMLIGALITVPLWLNLSKRLNDNKKVSIIGGITMIISFIPMIFVGGIIGWVISLFLFGVGLGGQWFMDPPTMGDVLDDIAVRTGKREPSVYYGYQTFFIRFGEAFKAATILLAHKFTGFEEGNKTLSELAANIDNLDLALFGIRIHTAIVPAILVIITTVLFWRFYPLTPDKIAENTRALQNSED
jgi:GPH family glycoside/pentoside/hexuronide:cation symporter